MQTKLRRPDDCLQMKKQRHRAVRRADKLSSKIKRSFQARADKLGTLGCKVALTHLSRKGASLKQALQACRAEQQLAMQQELQDKPDALLQLMQVVLHDSVSCFKLKLKRMGAVEWSLLLDATFL